MSGKIDFCGSGAGAGFGAGAGCGAGAGAGDADSIVACGADVVCAAGALLPFVMHP